MSAIYAYAQYGNRWFVYNRLVGRAVAAGITEPQAATLSDTLNLAAGEKPSYRLLAARAAGGIGTSAADKGAA